MLHAFAPHLGGLAPLPPGEQIARARWVDLYRPLDAQVRQVKALGIDVPTLEDLTSRVEAGDSLPVLPMADAARAQFAVRELDEAQACTLRYGQKLAPGGPTEAVVAAIAPGHEGEPDDLVAILDQSGPHPRSSVVFPLA